MYKLILPPNAAFQTLVGPSGKDVRQAKTLVCLEACKKLHQMGALNDHLVPFVEDPLEADNIIKNKESSAAAGAGAGINVFLIEFILAHHIFYYRDLQMFVYVIQSIRLLMLALLILLCFSHFKGPRKERSYTAQPVFEHYVVHGETNLMEPNFMLINLNSNVILFLKFILDSFFWSSQSLTMMWEI